MVKGWFTLNPEQGHIAQVPLNSFGDVDGSIQIGVVFSAVGTDEETLSFALPLASADMARFACVGFARGYHRYAFQHCLVLNHSSQAIVWHIADDSVEPFPPAFSSLPFPCEVSQGYARIGGTSEADYPFADPMEDGVDCTSFLRSDSFYDLG